MNIVNNSQIFELGRNGLEPLKVEGLSLGDAVREAHNGSVFWVIGEDQFGYTIANERGQQKTGQRLKALSPYLRISKTNDFPPIDAERIEELKAAVIAKREADRIAQAAAEKKHSEDKAAAIERFKAMYPNRVPDDAKISSYARAAKNIRKELAAAFPGVKFQVRSRSFSGGDSVDVDWTLGPTTAEVNAIIGKYNRGSFDGMQDLYEYDNDAVSEAFRIVMGSTKYAHSHREIPDDLRERVAADYRRQVSGFNEWELSSHVYRALEGVSFVGKEYAGKLENVGGRMVAKVKDGGAI